MQASKIIGEFRFSVRKGAFEASAPPGGHALNAPFRAFNVWNEAFGASRHGIGGRA
jgi:hypothetical protein